MQGKFELSLSVLTVANIKLPLGTERFPQFSHLVKAVVNMAMPPTSGKTESRDKAVHRIRVKGTVSRYF